MEPAMTDDLTPEVLKARVGQVLGVSEWLLIDQQRIDAFADVTEDHQFVHVDPQAAAATPFGGTIAHGLLTLSLIVRLCWDFVPRVRGTRLLLNYGFDKVRFVAPVKVGSRIRARGELAAVEERRARQVLIDLAVTIEIENQAKPALVAQWLSLHLLEDA
jgi:acyl dehydratase